MPGRTLGMLTEHSWEAFVRLLPAAWRTPPAATAVAAAVIVATAAAAAAVAADADTATMATFRSEPPGGWGHTSRVRGMAICSGGVQRARLRADTGV